MKQALSRRRFLLSTGLAASTAALAACVAPPTTAPAAPAQEGAGEAPAAAPPPAEAKVVEAWSRMTDVAAESQKGIIENYNAKNDKGIGI
mgnify:FL=1